MKKLSVIFMSIALLAGCAKKPQSISVSPHLPVISTTSSDTLSYLALGDSYTIGVGVYLQETYPYQLENSLNALSYHILQPIEIAEQGWKTADLINAIQVGGIDTTKFGIVTLLIGVNDEAQGVSPTDYRLNFSQLVNTAINLANGNAKHVFVLSIPDWGVTPFAKGQDATIGPQIDLFNDINKAITAGAGANYINVTDISRLAASDTTLLAEDELHPSAKMFTIWNNLLEPTVAAEIIK
jgi:lysophospholipase L1-like esterase